MNNRIILEDTIFYGRYYPNIGDNRDHYWWFCTFDYQIYSIDDLIKQFHYTDAESIERVGLFIPMFKTDMFELENQYLSLLPNDEKKLYRNIKQQNSNKDYNTIFNIFLDFSKSWKRFYEFEKKHLREDAIDWCRQYGICWTSLEGKKG